MKNAKSVIWSMMLLLAMSAPSFAKGGTISTTKAGTISTTRTGTISTTALGTVSSGRVGTISTTRAGIISTTRTEGNIRFGRVWIVDLLLNVY